MTAATPAVTPAAPGSRVERLRAAVAAAGLDALLVTHPPNVRYLTGLDASSARLLVTVDEAAPVLVTDGRYGQAAAAVDDVELVLTRGDDWLGQRLAAGTVLGLEAQHVSWRRARGLDAALAGVEVRAESGQVEALRASKDDGELAALQRACTLTSEAVGAVPGWLAPGMTERQVAGRLVAELLAAGAEDRAFAFIVAAGDHSARPHHRPTERVLARGDLVMVDMGATVDGYHADMTRMLALGEPEASLRRAHDIVRGAQAEGVAAVRAGATAGEVDAACRAPIEAAGYGGAFVHATGHGIGLEVHEPPTLRAGSTARLRVGAAVTVEPGIYLPGLGGVRIEDTVAVTADGCVRLTSAPTELVVL